jgi:hypothetical protein
MWSEYRASYAPRNYSALCVLAGSWRTSVTPTVAPLKSCRDSGFCGGAQRARGLPFLRSPRMLPRWVCGAPPHPGCFASAGLLLPNRPRRSAKAGDPHGSCARAPQGRKRMHDYRDCARLRSAGLYLARQRSQPGRNTQANADMFSADLAEEWRILVSSESIKGVSLLHSGILYAKNIRSPNYR